VPKDRQPEEASNEPVFETCPMPATPGADDEAAAVRRMLAAKRIAVVGMSDDPSRPSYGVAAYLRSVGKEIIPVNPTRAMVMGLKSYPTLEAVPGPIDVVDVFRRPEHCAEVARAAVAVGAKGLWLQSGIVNHEARQIARRAGIDYVEDRCMKVDHMFGGRG
jgi:predicted CoA-binding protein